MMGYAHAIPADVVPWRQLLPMRRQLVTSINSNRFPLFVIGDSLLFLEPCSRQAVHRKRSALRAPVASCRSPTSETPIDDPGDDLRNVEVLEGRRDRGQLATCTPDPLPFTSSEDLLRVSD